MGGTSGILAYYSMSNWIEFTLLVFDNRPYLTVIGILIYLQLKSYYPL